MIELQNITVSYGTIKALDGVSLSIADGERVALLGANGAGKSTLLREIAKRQLASGNGSCVMMPQDLPTDLAMTAHDYVMLGRTRFLSPWRRPAAADEDAVSAALAQVGATALAKRRMDEVSGGERQLLSLAMALASEAKTLLLDEPVSHLDQARKAQFYRILSHLPITVVASLHDFPQQTKSSAARDATMVESTFTRTIVLCDGRIVDDRQSTQTETLVL